MEKKIEDDLPEDDTPEAPPIVVPEPKPEAPPEPVQKPNASGAWGRDS